jgi:hypothetical protein
MRPPVEKVERRASALIPIPLFLGKLMDFFVTTVRKTLLKKGKKSVEAMWINRDGNPASKISFKFFIR